MSNPFLELQTRLADMTRRGCVQSVLSGDATPLVFVENEWREDGEIIPRATLDSMLLAAAPAEMKARLRASSDDSLEWTHAVGGEFFHFIVVSQNGARTATITAVNERGVTLGFEEVSPVQSRRESALESLPNQNSTSDKSGEDDGAFWQSVGELEAAVLAEAPVAEAPAPEPPTAKPAAAKPPAEKPKAPAAPALDAMEFEVGALGLPPRRWQFEHAGKRVGPVSTGKMIELITNKIVTRTTMAHHDEMIDWQQVKLTELDRIFERRSDLDPSMEAERLEAIDVRSSGNPYASLPGELIGINVGGLLVGPVWALANGIFGPGLLALLTPILFLRLREMIPLSNNSYDVMTPLRNIFLLAAIGLHLGFSVYFAIAGYELAWCNREWKSFAQFRKHQRLWAVAGIGTALAVLAAVYARANAPVVRVPAAAPGVKRTVANRTVETMPAPADSLVARPQASAARNPAKAPGAQTTRPQTPALQTPVATTAPDPATEADSSDANAAGEVPDEDLEP